MHKHAMFCLQDIHDFGQREAQTMGPRERVLADGLFTCDRWSFSSIHRAESSPSWVRLVLRCGESLRSGLVRGFPDENLE